MIDEKKLIEILSKNSIFEKITNAEGKNIFEIIDDMPTTDWIPCKVELPPMPKENPLFENKPIELYLVSLGYADYPIRAFWNGKIFTDGWSKLNVTAWQPLPQPYKKEGAE